MPYPMQSNSGANSVNPSNPGSQIMRPVNSQGQPHPNHPHPTQQPLSQAMHTNIGSTGKQAIGDSSADWRSQLHADFRQKIVNKLMDSLKMLIPFGGHERLHELEKIVVRFEERIYTAATSQSEYMRKISTKLMTMVPRSQNLMTYAIQSNSGASSVNPFDPGISRYTSYMILGIILK
ncbi:hypothetical protein LXL04_028943 [Taraxacum kok-saghyz]